jgi:hypothetical protein
VHRVGLLRGPDAGRHVAAGVRDLLVRGGVELGRVRAPQPGGGQLPGESTGGVGEEAAEHRADAYLGRSQRFQSRAPPHHPAAAPRIT